MQSLPYFPLTQVDPEKQHGKGGGFRVGITVSEFPGIIILSLGHVLRFRLNDPKEALAIGNSRAADLGDEAIFSNVDTALVRTHHCLMPASLPGHLQGNVV